MRSVLRFVVLLAACSGWLSTAQAYLIDANDARTVPPGTLEFELQPVGYLQSLGIDGERYLVAPSAMLYVGLGSRVDLILLARGYAGLDERGYSIDDGSVLLRTLVRDGSYGENERSGPSVVVQTGIYTPSLEGDSDWGASFAMLLSHSGDHATVHFNSQVDLRYRFSTFAVFGSVVVEAFPDSPVRPTLELFADIELEPGRASVDLSALVGGVWDVRDDLQLALGARAGDLVGDRELELRLSVWAAFDLRVGRQEEV